MNMYDPNAYQGLLQTQGQVGGNAANAGIGFGANVRAGDQGKQDAFQKLAMLRIMQGGARGKLSQEMQAKLQQLGIDAQQANPMDYIGAGIGGLNAIKGIVDRNDTYGKMGIKHKNIFESIFG